MNKYQTWYQNITDRARDRTLEGYVERHHVIPRSLGGSDDAGNLVSLTAREHFVCHWLLTKMYTGEARYKMLNALRMMRAEKIGQYRYSNKITARVYENIKEEYAQLQSVLRSGKGNGFYGKTHILKKQDNVLVLRTQAGYKPNKKKKNKSLLLPDVNVLRSLKNGEQRCLSQNKVRIIIDTVQWYLNPHVRRLATRFGDVSKLMKKKQGVVLQTWEKLGLKNCVRIAINR